MKVDSDLIFAFSIGALVTMLVVFLMAGGVPFLSYDRVAEKICESHGLELDYRENLNKVVCEEKPQDLSNKKVFEFYT